MKAKRNYHRVAPLTTAAKAIKNVEHRSELATYETSNDLTDASSHAINTIKIKKKFGRTKKATKSVKAVLRRAKIKEFLLQQEEENTVQRREAYEKRRAARMMHSSNKLYLSHRLTSIISYHSPQSPIECINLASQFTDSNSKILKVTRDTRQLRIHLHYK
jgi:hypothetical protein